MTSPTPAAPMTPRERAIEIAHTRQDEWWYEHECPSPNAIQMGLNDDRLCSMIEEAIIAALAPSPAQPVGELVEKLRQAAVYNLEALGMIQYGQIINEAADALARAEAHEDMANVGRAFMERIERDFKDHPRIKGWHPNDCPSELVGDLLNALDEAEAEKQEAVAACIAAANALASAEAEQQKWESCAKAWAHRAVENGERAEKVEAEKNALNERYVALLNELGKRNA